MLTCGYGGLVARLFGLVSVGVLRQRGPVALVAASIAGAHQEQCMDRLQPQLRSAPHRGQRLQQTVAALEPEIDAEHLSLVQVQVGFGSGRTVQPQETPEEALQSRRGILGTVAYAVEKKPSSKQGRATPEDADAPDADAFIVDIVFEFEEPMPSKTLEDRGTSRPSKTRIAMSVNCSEKQVRFEEDGPVITQHMKDAMKELATNLESDSSSAAATSSSRRAAEIAEPCSVDGLLRRSASWVAGAPVSFVLRRHVDCTIGPHHIEYLEKGKTYTAEWFDVYENKKGQSVEAWSSPADAENYACMGGCGAGCAVMFPEPTQDCLNHDACSYTEHSKFGLFDRNCGEAWICAADDFLFGGIGVRH